MKKLAAKLAQGLAVASAAVLLCGCGQALAEYGGGNYGNCNYGSDCVSLPPTGSGTSVPTGGSEPTSGGSSTSGNTGSTGNTSTSGTSPSQTQSTPQSGGKPQSPVFTPHYITNNSGAVQAQSPHSLTPGNFGGAVYQKIGLAMKQVPKPVAYGFPYALLTLLLLLIVGLIWQTKSEIKRIATIRANAAREKQLALEKDNFLMLTSHYLRTPLTVIKGNIELLGSLKQLPETVVKNLQALTAKVQNQAEAALKKLQDSRSLSTISAPAVQPPGHLLARPAVAVPLGLIILLVAAIQFVMVDFRVISPDIIDFIVQIGIAILLLQLFASRWRAHKIKQATRREEQRLLTQQRALDKSRLDFIKGVAAELDQSLAGLGEQLDGLAAGGVDTAKLRVGYDQLRDTTDKFALAARLEARAAELDKAPVASRALIQQVVDDNLSAAKEKGVSIDVEATKDRTVQQNQQLLRLAVNELISNAVKFSGANTSVQVTGGGDQGLQLTVVDHGEGLSQEQLDNLFKPFSHAESAETFNNEGLGFGLYLAKLATHYLGGDVTVASALGRGTTSKLTVPAA